MTIHKYGIISRIYSRSLVLLVGKRNKQGICPTIVSHNYGVKTEHSSIILYRFHFETDLLRVHTK